MKRLSVLGSTGSIGRNTLKIVEMFPDRFAVKALAAKTSTRLLAQQIERFRPEMAAVYDAKTARELKNLIKGRLRVDIVHGAEGYRAAAGHDAVDMTVAAMVGAAGLLPTLSAIEAGKDIALANKETLVMAGEIVMRRAAEKKVRILPVDSEHSAVFQCLQGQRREDLQKILLTASGGPFLNKPAAEFEKITPDEALNHPTWRMGQKITIDSATLMNKGLEVIEAHHLFGVTAEQVEVLIHPQSIIHSMVACHDGSVMAQIGIPDMKGAIAYALSYPERLPLGQPVPDFADIGRLVFQPLERGKFPCLDLAYEACRRGGTCPAVLNAANEAGVEAFLRQKIGFVDIPRMIERAMAQQREIKQPTLEDILAADEWARMFTREEIKKIVH